MKTKGSQKGTVRRKGDNWFIRFAEWAQDANGNLKYRETEKKICPAVGPDRRTKREAEVIGYERYVMPANGVAACPQGRATLRQFLEVRFDPEYITLQLKPNGQSFYRSVIRRHILPTLGDVALVDVSRAMVQGLIASKLQVGLSTQTCKHIQNCISAIFRHAKRLGFFRGDLPTEDLITPTVVHSERKALQPIQVRMIIETMPAEYRPLVHFVARTGCRIGEAIGLRWKRVNLTDEWIISDGHAIAPNSVLIKDNYTRGRYESPKTAAGVRTVPLSSGAWVVLMELKEAAGGDVNPEAPVFASRNGTPQDGHNIGTRHLKTAGKKAGAAWVTWHSFRHTAATLTDMVGITAAEKQALLGHSSEAMGLRYTHAHHESVRRSLEAAESDKPGRIRERSQ